MNVSTTLRRLLLTTALALPCAALAVPPAHAPAHGWRRKHDPTYAGYSGRNWERDYGVRSGSCDRRRSARCWAAWPGRDRCGHRR
jgi:hypothetical protein